MRRLTDGTTCQAPCITLLSCVSSSCAATKDEDKWHLMRSRPVHMALPCMQVLTTAPVAGPSIWPWLEESTSHTRRSPRRGISASCTLCGLRSLILGRHPKVGTTGRTLVECGRATLETRHDRRTTVFTVQCPDQDYTCVVPIRENARHRCDRHTERVKCSSKNYYDVSSLMVMPPDLIAARPRRV